MGFISRIQPNVDCDLLSITDVISQTLESIDSPSTKISLGLITNSEICKQSRCYQRLRKNTTSIRNFCIISLEK